MTRTDILQMIEVSLERAAGKAVSVTESSELIGDDIIDSLDAVRFVFELEKTAGVKLPDGDLDERGLFNVGNLITFIDQESSKS